MCCESRVKHVQCGVLLHRCDVSAFGSESCTPSWPSPSLPFSHRQQKPSPIAGVDFEQSHTFFSRKHLSPRAESNEVFLMLPNSVNFSTKLVCPNPFPFLCRSHLLQATSGILYFCGCIWPCEERVVFLKERRGRSLPNFLGRKPLLVRNNKLHHPGAYSHTGCCATEMTGCPDWTS